MGFLRRTFSRRSRSRFQARERDERDGKGGGEGGGGGGVTGNPLLLAHQQQVVHAPAVVTGGASVHIPAAGTARTTITCRVLLLDGSDVNVDLPVSALELAECKQSTWRRTIGSLGQCVSKCGPGTPWGPYRGSRWSPAEMRY